MHLITVIVITYNSSKTVIETLESIKNQTYVDIELIVTDDCSMDDTVDKVEHWIKVNKDRFSEYKLITAEKNTGVTGNLARGIAAAHGSYYKSIAGDDILRSNAIEVFSNYITERVIYQAQVASFYENDAAKVYMSETDEFNRINKSFLKMNQKQQYIKLLKGNVVHAVGIGLIKIEDYKSVGGVEERYPWIEDYPLWVKFSEAGYAFREIKDTLIDYRVSSGSISHEKPMGYFLDEAKFYTDYRFGALIKSGFYLYAISRWIKYSLKKINIHLRRR